MSLSEHITEHEDTEETDVQLLYQNKDSLRPEYQNDIGLWQKITNEVKHFWCDRDPMDFIRHSELKTLKLKYLRNIYVKHFFELINVLDFVIAATRRGV